MSNNQFVVDVAGLDELTKAIRENTAALKAVAEAGTVSDRGLVTPKFEGVILDGEKDEEPQDKPSNTGSALDDVGGEDSSDNEALAAAGQPEDSEGPELAPRNAWYQHEDGSVFAVTKGDPIPDYVAKSKKITRDQFNTIHKERKEANQEANGTKEAEPKLEDFKTEDKPAEADPWGAPEPEQEPEVDYPDWTLASHVVKAFAAKHGSAKVTSLMDGFGIANLSGMKDENLENAGKVRQDILAALQAKDDATYQAAVANHNDG